MMIYRNGVYKKLQLERRIAVQEYRVIKILEIYLKEKVSQGK
jgi:hypothetical protein